MALDEPDAQQASLGAEIRRRRVQHGLTLTNLAAQARISHPFLSQLERGYARPSMTTLQRIARALETTQVGLMLASHRDGANRGDEVPDGVQLVRAGDGATVPHDGDSPGHARLLVGEQAAFYPQEHVVARREHGEYYEHPQDEWVHVVESEIEVDLGDGNLVTLRASDSLYYPGGTPHRWRLTGPRVARVIMVQASR